MPDWGTVSSKEGIEKSIMALTSNGIDAEYLSSGKDVIKRLKELIPAGSEVFTASSTTLDTLGISTEINESGVFDAVKAKLVKMDGTSQGREMRKLGAGPDFAVGSVHAITESGSLVIASMTGSQLPAYAFGAGKVIWVVGAQKIVKDTDEAFRRLNEYVVPRESARARKAYGLPAGYNSYPSKVLIVNREVQPGRVRVIIVGEALGF